MLRKTSVALAVLAGLAGGPAHAFTVVDDFSAASISTDWWTASALNGNTVAQTAGRLEMTQLQIDGGSALGFNYPVVGDFVATVDYQLLDWPALNYERIGLAGNWGAMERSQHEGWFGEAYVSHFSGLGDGVVAAPTTDSQGTLRVVRSGETLTGSYWNGSGWTQVRSFSSPAVAADTTIGFSIWNGYASVPVKVAFDNFQLDAPQMLDPRPPIPEPSTYALLLAGLGIVGWAARRRGTRG